jgi:hypothetical protein
MPANYVLLEKITVTEAGASSVTFSNIPQTGYTDLILITSVRESGNNGVAKLTFNSTTSGYTARQVYAGGTSASSDSGYGGSFYGADGSSVISGWTAGTFSNSSYYIPNYTNSNYKNIIFNGVTENNGSNVNLGASAGLWSNTSPITSITVTEYSGSGTFVQYSTFCLYGIAALGTTPAIAPYATGGDTIMTDGTYWYHIFSASGSFVPTKNLSCSVIAIGGGGSGGSSTGGGGGGGEVETYSTISTTANTTYTATVGAGGAAHTSQSVQYSGSSSTFSTITALGGGGGGNEQTITNGAAGGSGGGGGWQGSGGSASGANTFAGGNGYNPSGQSAGGGGGGATAAGANATNTNAGAGGAGYLVSSLDSALSTIGPFASMTRVSSGGGGGASSTRTAASGGTGAGNGTNSVTSGGNATSFGSGGGGGGWVGGVGAGGGGSGYSGVVVVRYAA